jgi:hypothetical protein
LLEEIEARLAQKQNSDPSQPPHPMQIQTTASDSTLPIKYTTANENLNLSGIAVVTLVNIKTPPQMLVDTGVHERQEESAIKYDKNGKTRAREIGYPGFFMIMLLPRLHPVLVV